MVPVAKQMLYFERYAKLMAPDSAAAAFAATTVVEDQAG